MSEKRECDICRGRVDSVRADDSGWGRVTFKSYTDAKTATLVDLCPPCLKAMIGEIRKVRDALVDQVVP